MENNFTLKCNKCGSESILDLEFDKYYKGSDGHIRYSGSVKVCNDGYGGEIGVYCNCGNEIYDGYSNPQKGAE